MLGLRGRFERTSNVTFPAQAIDALVTFETRIAWSDEESHKTNRAEASRSHRGLGRGYQKGLLWC